MNFDFEISIADCTYIFISPHIDIIHSKPLLHQASVIQRLQAFQTSNADGNTGEGIDPFLLQETFQRNHLRLVIWFTEVAIIP